MKKIKIKIKIIALFFILISCSKVEEVREKRFFEKKDPFIEGNLSIEDSIKLSLKYNKKLLSIFQEKGIAKAEKIEATSDILPKVLTSFSYSRLDKSPSIYVNGKRLDLNNLDNYSIDLKVEQPLFYGGGIIFKIASSSLNEKLAIEKIKRGIEVTVYSSVKSYLDLLLEKKLFEVQNKSFLATKRHLKDVEDKIENDIASKYDLLRAKVEVANFQAELIHIKNNIELLEANLFKILGVSQMSKIELKDDLKYVKKEIDIKDAIKIAFKNRPDLKMAKLSVDIQKKMVGVARSKFFPTVDFVYFNKWGNPYTYKDRWGRDWFYGISLNWPFFVGFKRKGNLMKQKTIFEKKRYDLENVEENIFLEVKKAIFSIKNADELIKSQILDLERAKEALNLVENGYREGVNSEIEVTDALSALTKSQSLYYRSLYNHELSVLNLEFSMGLLSFEKKEKK